MSTYKKTPKSFVTILYEEDFLEPHGQTYRKIFLTTHSFINLDMLGIYMTELQTTCVYSVYIWHMYQMFKACLLRTRLFWPWTQLSYYTPDNLLVWVVLLGVILLLSSCSVWCVPLFVETGGFSLVNCVFLQIHIHTQWWNYEAKHAGTIQKQLQQNKQAVILSMTEVCNWLKMFYCQFLKELQFGFWEKSPDDLLSCSHDKMQSWHRITQSCNSGCSL